MNRLSVTKIPVKSNQLTLMKNKNCKENNNNNINNVCYVVIETKQSSNKRMQQIYMKRV